MLVTEFSKLETRVMAQPPPSSDLTDVLKAISAEAYQVIKLIALGHLRPIFLQLQFRKSMNL